MSPLAADVDDAADLLIRLAAIQHLLAATKEAEVATVEAGRASGLSWTELAAQLGISKQALRARHLHRPDPKDTVRPDDPKPTDRPTRPRTDVATGASEQAPAEYELRPLLPWFDKPIARIVRRQP